MFLLGVGSMSRNLKIGVERAGNRMGFSVILAPLSFRQRGQDVESLEPWRFWRMSKMPGTQAPAGRVDVTNKASAV